MEDKVTIQIYATTYQWVVNLANARDISVEELIQHLILHIDLEPQEYDSDSKDFD